MNLRHGKRKNESGNVILICVMFSVVLGITIASYLLVVRSQYISNARSHNWNISLVLAEAGVEDALALVNKNVGDFPNLKNWPASAAADGWTQDLNVFHVQRTPDASLGFYEVWITNLNNAVGIRVEGTATWDTSNPDPTENGGNVRKLVVLAGVEPLFSMAVGAGSDINLNGNSIQVDSFDSSDPTHSRFNSNWTFGVYDPTKHKDGGIVAANGVIKGAPGPNSATIFGYVNTGPGGTTNLQQNGSIGDLNWGQPGIQPGHGQNTMNAAYPPVRLPATNFYPLVTGSWIDPISITNSGYYQVIDTMGLKQSLTVDASNVVLYLQHGLDYGNANRRLRVTTNSSLTIYVGEQFTVDDNSAIRVTNADNLILYGLTNLTSINLAGTTNFMGSIYAPQANLIIGADGGPYSLSTYSLGGSAVVGSIQNLNPIQFHYDENLRRTGPGRAYITTNWTEL